MDEYIRWVLLMFLAVLTSILIASYRFVRGLTLQLSYCSHHTCMPYILVIRASSYNLDLDHTLQNDYTKSSKADTTYFSCAPSPYTALQDMQAILFSNLFTIEKHRQALDLGIINSMHVQ